MASFYQSTAFSIKRAFSAASPTALDRDPCAPRQFHRIVPGDAA